MKITIDNKCPSCGANVKFNPTTQKWDCEYCGNSYEIEEFEKQQEKETKENLGFEIFFMKGLVASFSLPQIRLA